MVLDTGSTLSGTFSNAAFMSDIRKSKEPITFKTHTGLATMDMEGDVDGLGTVWYDPTSIGNVIGFAHLTERYKVTYNSEQEDAFCVHLPDKIVKFHRTSEGLYAYRPSGKYR